MKYNKIMFFFGLSAPIGILARIIQIVLTTDSKGFTISHYAKTSLGLSIIVLATAIISGVFGFLTHRFPKSVSKKGITVSVFSALLGILIVADLLVFIPISVTVPSWQNYAMLFFGFLAAAVYILFAVRSLILIEIPGVLFIFPVVYWIVRIIWSFTLINALALTSDHVNLLLCHCAVLLFMLELSKTMSGVDKEYGFKKLLAYGLCSSSLCFSYSLSYIILAAVGRGAIVDRYSPILILLLAGAFILSFVLTKLRKSNIE